MLNVRIVCRLMNVFVVSTWLQHRVIAPDKRGFQFSVLEGIFNIFNFAIFDTCTSDYFF